MARFVRKPRPHAQRRSHGHDDEHHDDASADVDGDFEAPESGGHETEAADHGADVEPNLPSGVASDEDAPSPLAGSGDDLGGAADVTADPDVAETEVAETEDDMMVGFGPPAEAAPLVEETVELFEATAEAVEVSARTPEIAEPPEASGPDGGDADADEVGDGDAVEGADGESGEDTAGDGNGAPGEDVGTGAEMRTIKRRRRRRRPGPGSVEGQESDEAAEGDSGGESAAAPERAEDTRRQQPKRQAQDDKDERARLQMLIHVEGERVQVSVLEGRTLAEHYVADRSTQSIAGNIYLGKVQNVLPGMEAAFIDIGTPKNAVLYAGDVRFIDEEFGGKQPRIEDVLDVGQSVLVQVVKDPMGSKGARLTTEISLPGRFLVLVPENDSTGISRRLQESERERLRDVLRRIRPDGFGVIVRTAAEFTSEDKLALDMERLEELWKKVYLEATRVNPPCLVYEEPDLVIRTVREIFSGEFRRLIVDDQDVYDKIVGYLGDYEPDLLQRITLYDDEMSLYRRYHVAEQLRQGLARKVWLPSGGSLVFDIAEALTVIDVNTSKNVGKNSLEETVYANNLEAADEIARQLRLRDIGGIIVIDFIDMENAKNRQGVLRAFKEAVGRDKTKTQVYDISELGLVEMTRKNVSEGLIHAFSHACNNCNGRGLLMDDDF